MASIKLYAMQIEEINNKIKQLENQKAKLSEKLLNLMSEKNEENFVVDDGSDKVLSVRSIQLSKIKFDVEKAKKCLGDNFKKYCDKNYTVDKIELDILLKKYPEIKKQLKRTIVANYDINKSKIEQARQLGEISASEIKSFSEQTLTNYVKIQRVKRQENSNE